ncbi:MAG: division/cell wall cluster transcriptional repressor MraZ [Lachnospiraceae bacterium]|nr:division/cell wall cluster transcriptional repressor MraZ [Lachnospiraceae bacterium]
MYKGDYSHSIDEKGRIIIPQKFREELGEGFVITKGMDECLWILDAKAWNKLEYGLRSMSVLDKKTRRFQMHFSASAVDGETDKQGRILLPASLRKYASLSKDVVFCGMINRIEIWDKEKYEEQGDAPEDLESLAEEMNEGIDISF